MLAAISTSLPATSLASPDQILRNARKVAVGAVALSMLANLPKADAGPIAGILAGVGTAIVGGVIVAVGVVTVNPAIAAAGVVVIGKAPVVGVAVGVSPTL